MEPSLYRIESKYSKLNFLKYKSRYKLNLKIKIKILICEIKNLGFNW